MNCSRFVLLSLTAVALAAVPAAGGQTASRRPEITGLSHISVYAADSAKAEAFYVHDLGAFRAADPENPQGVRYYFSPSQWVEVLPLPPNYTSINRLDHIAFTTRDAEALRKYMGANGIAVPASVQSGRDGSRWFDVKDPEGNTVQFVQAGGNSPDIPRDALSSHMIHVGYLVHDPNAENAFYRKVLGFRPYWYGGAKDGVPSWISQQVPDGTDWIEYMLVDSPEKTGIPSTVTAAQLGGMDHFSLGVQNMEKTATVLYAGDRIPERSGGPKIGRDGKWQYNLFSPDGTRAELMEFQPAAKPCCSEFTASSPTE